MRQPIQYRIIQVLDPSVVAFMNGAFPSVVLEIATAVVRNAVRFGCIGYIHGRPVTANEQRGQDMAWVLHLHVPSRLWSCGGGKDSLVGVQTNQFPRAVDLARTMFSMSSDER